LIGGAVIRAGDLVIDAHCALARTDGVRAFGIATNSRGSKDMAIKATEISDLIEQRIEGFKDATEPQCRAIVSVLTAFAAFTVLRMRATAKCWSFRATLRARLEPRRDWVGGRGAGRIKVARKGDDRQDTGRILECPWA